MKKAKHLTVWMALGLLCFTCGFLLGRNSNRAVLKVSQSTQLQPEATTAESTLININTATLQELTMLPGVGPSVAQDIIDFRNANGPFRKPEELVQVDGIGMQKLKNILKYITVGGGL